MKNLKIISVVGARPQFIKSAPVSKAFKENKVNEIIIHTGQHFDPNMSSVFFEQLHIPREKYNLNINSLSHGAMTGRMMEKIETILSKEAPDFVLVYGDTNSTLAAALAAAKLHIKIIHIEAGLRSFNRFMPEEINRVLTDNLSYMLFCPSEESVFNLKKEGITAGEDKKINIVGDVMKDAVKLFSSNEKSKKVNNRILVTIHREENIKELSKLKIIIDSLNQLSKQFEIIFPIHPSTKNKIKQNKLFLSFKAIDPLNFIDMINSVKESSLVITDSGGLQKDAYYLETPCVVLRDQTEWVELLKYDVNTLCPINKKDINDLVIKKLNSDYYFDANIYGNGDTANKIVKTILNGG